MQSGAKTASVSTGPVGNSVPLVKLKYADTTYYQIDKSGDYVQEIH